MAGCYKRIFDSWRATMTIHTAYMLDYVGLPPPEGNLDIKNVEYLVFSYETPTNVFRSFLELLPLRVRTSSQFLRYTTQLRTAIAFLTLAYGHMKCCHSRNAVSLIATVIIHTAYMLGYGVLLPPLAKQKGA
jgi:hypothetical protein